METISERGSKTKQKMIQVAFDLFHKHGVHDTSVEQVLAQSGTGKSQFYHYFGSKEGLVHAVLQVMCERMKRNEGLVDMRLESLQDLRRWFEEHLRIFKSFGCERGCPVGTIGGGLDKSEELLRQDIKLLIEIMRGYLVQLFAALRVKNHIMETASPEQLADFCLATLQGGLLIGKIQCDSYPLENAIEHTMRYLQGQAASGREKSA